MKRSLIETVLGGVVLLVAGLFIIFAYNMSSVRKSGAGYNLKASFNKIDGISVGSDVRISGIKVGTVTDLALDPQTFQAGLKVQVDKKIQLPTDTVIKIESEGLLGGHYISLVPGGEEAVMKPGEAFTYTESATSLSDLISRFVFSSANQKKPEDTTPQPAPATAPPVMEQPAPEVVPQQ